jgi:hypothetical protein
VHSAPNGLRRGLLSAALRAGSRPCQNAETRGACPAPTYPTLRAGAARRSIRDRGCG